MPDEVMPTSDGETRKVGEAEMRYHGARPPNASVQIMTGATCQKPPTMDPALSAWGKIFFSALTLALARAGACFSARREP